MRRELSGHLACLPEATRRLACDASITPVTVSPLGQVLNVGHWADGDPTSLANLTNRQYALSCVAAA